jgi:CRP-like cAMP-binding protein
MKNFKSVSFLPHDEIIRQGDQSQNIYFVINGEAKVIMKSERHYI